MESQDRTPSEDPLRGSVGDPDDTRQSSAQKKADPPKKRFTLSQVVPTVTARVHLPFLYEGFEPFVFVFRIALTKDMQAQREAYLALAPSKRKEGFEKQRLDEVCDLLSALPEGFGDIGSVVEGGTAMKSPGECFREYYNAAVKRGPNHKATLDMIVEGAYNIYTSSVAPQEFFQTPADSGA
jgi:hypothetical protein